jgi:hypothetical protein
MGNSNSIYDSFIYNNTRLDKDTPINDDFIEEGYLDEIHYLKLVIEQNKRKKVIMISHANCMHSYSRIDLIKYLYEQFSCDVFIYDYYGFGKSLGKPCTKNCLLSSRKIYKMLLQHYPNNDQYCNIALWGESIGGGVNAELFKYLVEHKLPLPFLIIHHHSFDNLKNVIRTKGLPFLPKKIFDKIPIEQYPVKDIYDKLLPDNLPLVIIYSPQDTFIISELSINLYHSLKKTKNVKLIENYGKHCSFILYTEDIFSIRSLFQWNDVSDEDII